MKEVYEKIKNFKLFKDMPADDLEKIIPYQKAFFINRKYPRFFQSYLYLKSERKYFFYGFVDDCFILIKKKKEFGNRVCYLVLPPISLTGDLKKEFQVIEDFRLAGIKTKVSDEDLELYNLTKKQVTKEKDNIEMIYNPNLYNTFSSKKLANFRYAWNRLEILVKNKLSKNTSNYLTDLDLKNNNILLERWSAEKRKNGIKSAGDYCHDWFNELNCAKYFEILKFTENVDKKEILIASICEEILPNRVILDTNYADYSIQIPGFEAVKAMHVWLMKSYPEDTLINSGSGGWDKGLTSHKRFLKPCKELQIYDTKIEGKISEEDYQYVCKGSEL